MEEQNHLTNEIIWMLTVMEWQLNKCFYEIKTTDPKNWEDIPVPSLLEGDSWYKNLVLEFKLNTQQRLIFAMTVAPVFVPGDWAEVITKRESYRESDLALVKTPANLFLPTGLTALFLLFGKHQVEKKIESLSLILSHPLLPAGVIGIKSGSESDLLLGMIALGENFYLRLKNEYGSNKTVK